MHAILITWNPLDWKTTAAMAIAKELADTGKQYMLISFDGYYSEYIKEKREYMYWINIDKNIQRHYERMDDEVKRWFAFRLKEYLEQIEWEYIIIEWWHLMSMMNNVVKILMKRWCEITTLMMWLGWCMLFEWQKIERDGNIYKKVLHLD